MAKELKYALLHEDGSLTSKKAASIIPDVHVTDLIFEKLVSHGDKPLFIDGPNGRVLTAAEVKELVTKLALGLLDLGVEEGDVVFGFCPNSSNYACMVLAIISIGATYSGCMYTYPKRDLSCRLTDSCSKFLLCYVKNQELAVEVADEMDGIKGVIVIDSESNDQNSTPSGKKMVTLQQMVNREVKDTDASIPLVIKKSPKEAVSNIFYSSGSTGLPKGVLRSHFSLVASLLGVPEGMHFVGIPGGAFSCHTPMPHGSGTWTTIQCVFLGIKVIFNDGFRTETFLETVEKHQVDHAFISPPYIVILSKSEETVMKYDISSLKSVITGGAPLPVSVIPKFKSLIGIERLYQMYGSTESGFVVSTPADVDDFVTSGCPLPLHRIKIVNPSTGKVLGPNEIGEIHDTSAELALGYLNRPEADEENFYEDEVGRWIKSGDAGYFDEDGLFYIVDRYKEVIKVDTEQVAPAELESIFLSHDDVSEAAVVGIPDLDHGEIPKAFIVPKDKDNLPSADELIKLVDEQVVDYKKIRGGIQFIESIPKISVGKPDRVTLKKNPETLKYL